jgi:hypothetical protein
MNHALIMIMNLTCCLAVSRTPLVTIHRDDTSYMPTARPTMAQPSIPQDIINSIVGNIDNRKKSLLRTCTLVSRSFLYPSRKQLFAHISLRSPKYCRGFLDLLVEHPYFQSYVKSLWILHPGDSTSVSHLLEVLAPEHLHEIGATAFENHLLPVLQLPLLFRHSTCAQIQPLRLIGARSPGT